MTVMVSLLLGVSPTTLYVVEPQRPYSSERSKEVSIPITESIAIYHGLLSMSSHIPLKKSPSSLLPGANIPIGLSKSARRVREQKGVQTHCVTLAPMWNTTISLLAVLPLYLPSASG